MFTEDLSVFLQDFGVPISFAGSAAGMLGIEDMPELTVLDDQGRAAVSTTRRTVLVRTDQKGALTQGSAITVNGNSRVVHDLGVPPELPDGAFTLVVLR